MAQAFAADPRREGALIGRMEPIEIELVSEVLRQTKSLLDEDSTDGDESPSGADEHDVFSQFSSTMEDRPVPEDPALRRLLPDGAGDDAEASREFRRLTEDSIRQQKRRNLETALAAFERHAGKRGSKVELSRDEARAAMIALTDVRLVLAERLGVHTEEDAETLHGLVEGLDAPRSERELTAMYYDFITWLSESLTVAYLGGSTP